MVETEFRVGSVADTRLARLIELLQSQGISVENATYQHKYDVAGQLRMLLKHGSKTLAAVVYMGDGRRDRLIPQMGLCILESRVFAGEMGGNAQPLVIALIPIATNSHFEAIEKMFKRLAPDVGWAVVSQDGSWRIQLRDFSNQKQLHKQIYRYSGPSTSTSVNLFSDGNQWLLKTLFAEYLPEGTINAPRTTYISGRQLAERALVSHVSANRFVSQLMIEGYLDTKADHLKLKNRKDLLLRWRAACNTSKTELKANFLFPSNADSLLRKLMRANYENACLGLFAAADALGVGHVSGTPIYLYVPKLSEVTLGLGGWRELKPVNASEAAAVIIRQAPFPKSIYRGSVNRDGMRCTDLLQTWLDVSYHPMRGQEQANLIYEQHLRKFIEPAA